MKYLFPKLLATLVALTLNAAVVRAAENASGDWKWSITTQNGDTFDSTAKLKQDGDLRLVRGLYALCPYIAGEWPQERLPSTIENNGRRARMNARSSMWRPDARGRVCRGLRRSIAGPGRIKLSDLSHSLMLGNTAPC